MKAYRSKSRLVLDLLGAIEREGPVGVTRLLVVANLTHARLHELLTSFEAKTWVASKREEDRVLWTLTEAGRLVLADLRRIDSTMQDFGLGL